MFFFKQKTAYELRSSDWSSDVCSSDLLLADDKDDVILATRDGFVTRFSVSDLRMFVGRNSTGVRGISLGKGDEVISASILRSFQATAIERQAYLEGGTPRGKEDGATGHASGKERVSE